jgi:hypothetical protein
MNTNEFLGDKMTQDFSSEVHLLAGKLVSVVAIHPPGGLHANRHHTSNPQLGATQPTQYRDPQAMSNPLELPFMISHEEGIRTPSQITERWPTTITNSCQHSSAAPSHLGIGERQE